MRSRSVASLTFSLAAACADATSSTPSVFRQGAITIPANEGADLDAGVLSPSNTVADLYLSAIAGPHLQLSAPGLGNAYVLFGATAPSPSDCNGGGLAQEFWLDTLANDVYSCIRTGAGRNGYFHFSPWPPFGFDSVRVAYVVWTQ